MKNHQIRTPESNMIELADTVMATGDLIDITAVNEALAQRQVTETQLHGIGGIAVLGARATLDPNTETGYRVHELVSDDVDGFKHRMWVTRPAVPTENPLIVVTKPGWIEPIEAGVRFSIHTKLSELLPEAEIVSHATHGVGSSAEPVPFGELAEHGIDQMAEQGLMMLDAFFHRQRLAFVGTSMGTIIGNSLLRRNTELGKPLDIRGAVYFAPALVDPKNVATDMGLRFFPAIFKDGGQNLLFGTKPSHISMKIKDLLDAKPRMRDIPTILRQGIDILHGTPESEVDEVLREYFVAVINGDADPVGQHQMWLRKKEEFPNMIYEPIRGRGHGIAIEAHKAANKISKTIIKMGIYGSPDDSPQRGAA